MINASLTLSFSLKLVYIRLVPLESYKVALFGVISILEFSLEPILIITSDVSSTFSDSNSISIVLPFSGTPLNGL
jgi:hypothetical protein